MSAKFRVGQSQAQIQSAIGRKVVEIKTETELTLRRQVITLRAMLANAQRENTLRKAAQLKLAERIVELEAEANGKRRGSAHKIPAVPVASSGSSARGGAGQDRDRP